MADANVECRPFGSWRSPITSDLIVSESIGLSEVRLDGSDIYWLETRPQEGGRNVVVRRSPGQTRGSDVNAKPYNARTRVHEYGGGAWTVADGVLYFSNDATSNGGRPDRSLYRQPSTSQVVERLTPAPAEPGEEWRYADGCAPRRREGEAVM